MSSNFRAIGFAAPYRENLPVAILVIDQKENMDTRFTSVPEVSRESTSKGFPAMLPPWTHTCVMSTSLALKLELCSLRERKIYLWIYHFTLGLVVAIFLRQANKTGGRSCRW